MKQVLIDRRTAGYTGGQRQVDYVVATTNQRLDIQWVSPGALRTEVGITAAQWKTWGYPRDGGCFVLSAANFVPGLLRWDDQLGYVVWRGAAPAGERLDRVDIAAAAPAPALAPAVPAAAAAPALVVAAAPAAAPAPPANDGDDDGNDKEGDEEEEEEREGEDDFDWEEFLQRVHPDLRQR